MRTRLKQRQVDGKQRNDITLFNEIRLPIFGAEHSLAPRIEIANKGPELSIRTIEFAQICTMDQYYKF